MRGHCWHVSAWRRTVAVNIWNACQWLCISWWWIKIFVGNGIYVDLHVTQHAKSQTMNIYSANSAGSESTKGLIQCNPLLTIWRVYISTLILRVIWLKWRWWRYMSSPPMWLQNCASLFWNKDFQILFFCIIKFFPKMY